MRKDKEDQDFAFFLEKRLLPPGKLYPDDVPIQAMTLYHQGKGEGIPRGIAYYKGKYYVLESSGQGPYIIWEDS